MIFGSKFLAKTVTRVLLKSSIVHCCDVKKGSFYSLKALYQVEKRKKSWFKFLVNTGMSVDEIQYIPGKTTYLIKTDIYQTYFT